MNPEKGYLKDNKLTLLAEVKVLAGEDIDLWGVLSKYDSKKKTGMVGFNNQGE